MESTNNNPNPLVDDFAADLGRQLGRADIRDAKTLGRAIKVEIVRQWDSPEAFCRKHTWIIPKTLSLIINGGQKRVTKTLLLVIQATALAPKTQQ